MIERIVYSDRMERVLRRCKSNDRGLFAEVQRQVEKIIRKPQVGKPLRHTLKNRRRVHVGSFVLVCEFHEGELRFLDFDHHDKIYKKAK